jgi:hypothetical protein
LSGEQKYLIASLEHETSNLNPLNGQTMLITEFKSPSVQDNGENLSGKHSIEKIEASRDLLKLYALLESTYESSEYIKYSTSLEYLQLRRNE